MRKKQKKPLKISKDFETKIFSNRTNHKVIIYSVDLASQDKVLAHFKLKDERS
jgi:hypothetical protein